VNSFSRTKVGPRGRVTIPVAVQREAGIREGEDVVVTTTSPGVVTITTPQAIKDRIRAGSPAHGKGEPSYDAVKDVRDLRDGKVNETHGEDQGAPEQ
jgi:AbrB family looped-hinge helix DNA binding protein